MRKTSLKGAGFLWSLPNPILSALIGAFASLRRVVIALKSSA
jgi:hypothetical protein